MSKRRAKAPLIRSWLKSDLLFLKLSLDRGMPVVEVARFLGRDENEVQSKAEELRRVVAV